MPTREDALALDRADPLRDARDRFDLPPDLIYLDGNSLGACPTNVAGAVDRFVREGWASKLIHGWFSAGWWEAPERIGNEIARLLGAADGEVIVGESTSVQLYNVVTAAARLRPGRSVIVTDPGNFPTDRYMIDSVARALGMSVVEAAPDDLGAVLDEVGDQVGVVVLGAVDYRSGRLWDVPGATARAHRSGAPIVWDLCHAVGVVPLALDAHEVDFAVGCTYKFLSGGPGSPAFAYVAHRHVDRLDTALPGWHGHADPFRMDPRFAAAPGIARLRIGTPHMLSLVALEAALETLTDAGVTRMRAKSVSLTEFFVACVDALLPDPALRLLSPRDPARRGSHVALGHPDAVHLVEELGRRGVVLDHRPPDVMRFGLHPLYVSHDDVLQAVTRLAEALTTAAPQAV